MAFPKAGYDARRSPGKFKVNAYARLTRPTCYCALDTLAMVKIWSKFAGVDLPMAA